MAKDATIKLNELKLEELNQLLADKRSDLYLAKQSLADGSLTNTGKISQLKRQIAQIQTRINLVINQNEEEK